MWVKAGGRCSICRVQLITEETEQDDPSVFGEEAHIVGKGRTGPRAATIPDVDSHKNLILLCRKHHKQVDDQVGHYTIKRLKKIKRAHEEWISSLGTEGGNGPVRLIPDPTRPPKKILRLFLKGSDFWYFFDGATAFYPSWPGDISDEHADLIARLFDDLRDWMDVCSDIDSFQAKRDAAKAFDGYFKELAQAGFFVGARERFMLLIGGGSSDSSSWRTIDIEIQPVSHAQVVRADGKPLQFGDLTPKKDERETD